jgi:hypothetical protein
MSTSTSLTIGPISYFQARCARCHGPYGSFFPDSFRATPPEVVAKKTDEMCRGQGGMALAGADLEAQIEYQRSIQRGRVFVAVISVDGGEMRGEVTPGAAVTLVGQERVPASVEGHLWHCVLPKGEVRVEASGEGVATLTGLKRSFMSAE